MRRTTRTEFHDSRQAANDARAAMLAKLKLRAEPEPDPEAPTLTQINAAAVRWTNVGFTLDSDQFRTYQQAMESAARAPRFSGSMQLARLSGNPFPVHHDCAPVGRPIFDEFGWPDPDQHRTNRPGPVRELYGPIVWPDEGYPCQTCWAVGRWPWEPLRSCPADVDPATTLCIDHGGVAKPPKPERPEITTYIHDPGRIWGGELSRGLLQLIPPTYLTATPVVLP